MVRGCLRDLLLVCRRFSPSLVLLSLAHLVRFLDRFLDRSFGRFLSQIAGLLSDTVLGVGRWYWFLGKTQVLPNALPVMRLPVLLSQLPLAQVEPQVVSWLAFLAFST